MVLPWHKRLLLACAPPLASGALRVLAGSWRQSEIRGPGLSPRDCGNRRFIYAYWHEYLLSFIGSYRDSPIVGLASLSFDGELISRAMLRLGYPAPARGSSSRGGAAALLEMRQALASGLHGAMSVDGPRGPRRRAHRGAVKLAQISGLEVVPVGFASSSRLRLRSWDQTLVAAPFSRGVFVFGRPFAPEAGEEGLRRGLERMQSDLEALGVEAEETLRRL